MIQDSLRQLSCSFFGIRRCMVRLTLDSHPSIAILLLLLVSCYLCVYIYIYIYMLSCAVLVLVSFLSPLGRRRHNDVGLGEIGFLASIRRPHTAMCDLVLLLLVLLVLLSLLLLLLLVLLLVLLSLLLEPKRDRANDTGLF